MNNGTERNILLMKIGGISALVWVALQIVGNTLHPRLPSDYAMSMEHIAASNVWGIAHLILISDYFVLIPMIVGFAASFSKQPWGMRLGVPLIVVAVTVGVVQVALHPSALRILSENFTANPGAVDQNYLIILFEGFWSYNIILEVGHLLLIHIVVIIVAIGMLSESLYPKWIGWLGIAGGSVAAISLVIGEVILESSVLGDTITFGVGLLPSAVWLVAVGIVLLRYKPSSTKER
jgi:hypothetical protein